VYLTPIFLVWVFAIQLQWLPAAGWGRISSSPAENLRNLLLPMTALAFAEIGIVGRIVRAETLRVLQTDFIAAAVGKGLPRSYVLRRHALRPASLGLLNVIGLNIGSLLSGAVIIEVIFGIGGLGQVLLEATLNRDLYLILGLTVYTVVIYVGLNAIVDGLMFAADPRIRRSRT
jgi:peptide/nickel transport system permease protein